MKPIIKKRLEKIRRQAKKDARTFPISIDKSLTNRRKDKLIDDSWLIKENGKYTLSGASRVLLFIIATKGRLAHSKELVKNLNKHEWERYTGNVWETFFFYEREKMLGVKTELIIENGKDVNNYEIRVIEQFALHESKDDNNVGGEE